MKFKIIFPTGYNLVNEYNDNLDVNIILENSDIYFCTIFTLENVKQFLVGNINSFFWADNMVIIKDLKKESIENFINGALEGENFESIFYKIGKLGEVKGYPKLFEKIDNFSNGRE